MRDRLVTGRGVRNALAAAQVLVTFGCAPHKTGREAHAPDSSTAHAPAYVNPAEVPHPCPPQPTGPQIGKSDPLMTAVAPKLSEWATMWAAALPGFAIDSTWRTGSDRWVPQFAGRFEPLEPDSGDLTLALLGLRSPDGRYTLDIDWYQSISVDGEELDVGGEPDAKCLLIDNASRAESVLHQSGTPGGYHWGAWLSRGSFVVGGWADADDFGQWKQGYLWVHSLADSTVTTYETRIVSLDAYSRYERAWHAWLMKRYRALRASRPRT